MKEVGSGRVVSVSTARIVGQVALVRSCIGPRSVGPGGITASWKYSISTMKLSSGVLAGIVMFTCQVVVSPVGLVAVSLSVVRMSVAVVVFKVHGDARVQVEDAVSVVGDMVMVLEGIVFWDSFADRV